MTITKEEGLGSTRAFLNPRGSETLESKALLGDTTGVELLPAAVNVPKVFTFEMSRNV